MTLVIAWRTTKLIGGGHRGFQAYRPTRCFIKNCTLLFLCIKNKPLTAKLWNLVGKTICGVPVFNIQEINISLNILCTRWRLITSYVICCRVIVQLLTRETPDFIPPSLWPPNSPDLNPVDYHVWGVLQERVYRENIRTLDELRQRITEEWEHMDAHRQCCQSVASASASPCLCFCKRRTFWTFVVKHQCWTVLAINGDFRCWRKLILH